MGTTHALEDQYWPIDPPELHESRASTDTDVARTFLVEGSATRLMIEALPAQFESRKPGTYVLAWNLLHSGLGEFAMNFLMRRVWKDPDVQVPGVPEALARAQAMPYAFGYSFCTGILRDWGLDGLDYIYDHPPVSSTQIMHPQKCWQWRDFPVQIGLAETLPGGWKRLTDDTVGEAGMASLLGSQLKNLDRGLRLARGWDGDRTALYEGTRGARLLVWASSWDSPSAALRFAGAWAEERRKLHHATLTRPTDRRLAWTRPDGAAGIVRCEGKRLLLLETDQPGALVEAEAGPAPATPSPPNLNLNLNPNPLAAARRAQRRRPSPNRPRTPRAPPPTPHSSASTPCSPRARTAIIWSPNHSAACSNATTKTVSARPTGSSWASSANGATQLPSPNGSSAGAWLPNTSPRPGAGLPRPRCCPGASSGAISRLPCPRLPPMRSLATPSFGGWLPA